MFQCPEPLGGVLWLSLLVCASAACSGQQAPQAETRPTRYWDPAAGAQLGQGAPGDPVIGSDPGRSAPQDVTPSEGRACDKQGRAEPLLGPKAPWNQSVRAAPLARDSARIIEYLAKNHAGRHRFATDMSIVMLVADAKVQRLPFQKNDAFYSPDCDFVPVPVPSGGRIEGESGYACEHDGDCHLIVHVPSECRLYEMWRADIRGKEFRGGCLAVWETNRDYPETLRGAECTSADAGGLPIAPLLFTASEVRSGRIRHAIRFILPNQHIRRRQYVPPATHATGATRGPEEAPPYGSRLRLRATFSPERLTPGARVVAEALKEYGMILADGGLVTFTAASDWGSSDSWGDVGFGARDLTSLEWEDFEVVDTGPAREWRGECRRNPFGS